MTISEVRGFGRQLGVVQPGEASEAVEPAPKRMLLLKLRVEIIVADELVDVALQKLTDAARTGEIGDGKIFVSPVESAIRIRTGESGVEVL